MKRKLRIAVNAQIPEKSGAGGIETVLRILTAVGRLEGDEEEYVFIGHWDDADWLKSLLGERQTLVRAPRPEQRQPHRFENLKRALEPIRPLARGVKRFVTAPPNLQIDIPISDGFYENLNCDVIHFPYQDFVRCSVPSVYNPHDLQHLHFPEFFAPAEIQRRETVYPAACQAARIVVVASQFVKRDVMQRYGIEAGKIQVVPWSPSEIELKEFTEDDANSLFEKYKCPRGSFVLYPAMTWEHKNHIRLLEAFHLLRERENLKINLVCTGDKNSFYPRIERRVRELKLEEQVKFTGIVTTEELSLFYRRAQFVVVPTLFEAASAPLFEAWQHAVAVACSSVTSLPEQAAGAALLFNPFSIEDIANAVRTMASDAELRAELRARGLKRLRNFDAENMLKTYRAVYRKAAGVSLNDEDRHLLG